MTTEQAAGMNPNYEKLKTWLDRHEISQAHIAEKLEVSQSYVTPLLRSSTMSTAYHKKLVELGTPENLLPEPFDKRKGRPRKRGTFPLPPKDCAASHSKQSA